MPTVAYCIMDRMLPFLYTFYRFGRGLWSALKDPEFEALFTLVVIILLTGMYFYHSTEHWSYLDSLYFSVITLTTVGYGDLIVHSAAGKIFTIVYLFLGIGVLLAFINTVAHHALIESRKGKVLSHRFGLRKKD